MKTLTYIHKIQAKLSIPIHKKTRNLLEGNYKSIYQGKSLNFENLREYTINDDYKDIDWKSSARSGNLLVKQFIAEKKHNVLLILDTGLKMEAVTDELENKKDLATFIAGTIGYLAINNKDKVAMIYQKEKLEWKPWKENLYALEEYLSDYNHNMPKENYSIEKTLQEVVKNIQERKVIFIITDLAGLNLIEKKTLQALKQTSDIFLICIKDHEMHGENIWDVTDEKQIPEFFLKDEQLKEIEEKIKSEFWQKKKRNLKRLKINSVMIHKEEEINEKIIKLLEG